MCGIYGATNRDKYLTLQSLNHSRGDFCESNVLIKKDTGFEIHKVPSKAKKEYKFPKRKKFDIFLGHSQAPTSKKRIFDPETSHPFIVDNWIVAHNGVLTNYKELVNDFKRPYTCDVDSSIIPFIFYSLENYYDNELDIIVNGLEFLKGTFGLWIYNTNSNNIYLAKCGVTLFADIYNNEFSSIKHQFYDPLDEGVVYQLTQEGITSVATFDCDSPFFTV
jgi:glucosamine 6-phosphate synthetase-like amidotransferase/phosphosugar isomerase protein